MKGLAWGLKHKRNKTADDLALEEGIASSFDISSPSYLARILASAQAKDTNEHSGHQSVSNSHFFGQKSRKLYT